jgi:DNA topoisomerase VI subunit A
MTFLSFIWNYKQFVIYFIIAFTLLVGYNSYKKIALDNLSLNNLVEQLKIENIEKDQQIDLIKKNVKVVTKIQERVSITKEKLDRKTEALNKILNKHDIQTLAFKKPNLIEKVINDASEQKRKCLEDITSSPKCIVD